MKTKIILFLISMSVLSFLRAQNPSPGFAWAEQLGGDSVIQSNHAVTDYLGNLVITGSFKGTVDLNPGEGQQLFTSEAMSAIFIQKLDPSGNLLWAYSMGDYSNDIGFDVVTDASGNIYFTGYFWGTIDADPDPQVEYLLTQDRITAFVIKYSPAGSFIWAKQFGSGNMGHAEGFAIGLDASGNVIIAGTFYGKVDFDPGSGTSYMTSVMGSWDGFVEKLDPSGNFLWAKQITGNSNKITYSLAIDAFNNIYTCGWFNGTVDFNPDRKLKFNLTSYGDNDAFMEKLNSNGEFIWAKQFGGASSDGSYSISLDNNNNPYLTGWFYGAADFNPGTDNFQLTPFGGDDAYYLKLNSSGEFAWAKQLGGPSWEAGNEIVLDDAGNIYIGGFFHSTADFDPGNGTLFLTSEGFDDSFVFKADPEGNLLWVSQTGGAGWDYNMTLAVDAAGNIYNLGCFEGTADFNPDGNGIFNMTNAGEKDLFIQKLTPTGGSNCPVPSGLNAVIGDDLSTANLSWTEVTGAGGYFVKYRDVNASDWTLFNGLVTSNSLVLSGLIPSTTYVFQVKTACESNYSYSYEFITEEPECVDIYEPNGNMASSADIPINTDITAMISAYSEIDWFHFQPTTQAKNIRITLSDLPENYDLRLYSGDGTMLGSSANTGTMNDTIVYNSNKVRIYYVLVLGQMGVYDPIECYTLHVTTSSTAFTKSAEAGIPGTPEADMINVYPNPARNNLNIDIVSELAGNASVSLINASGQSILEKEIKVTSGYTHTVLDASSLPNGIYIVRITTDKEVTVRKIVIQK